MPIMRVRETSEARRCQRGLLEPTGRGTDTYSSGSLLHQERDSPLGHTPRGKCMELSRVFPKEQGKGEPKLAGGGSKSISAPCWRMGTQ